MQAAERALDLFRQTFEGEPTGLVCSPGRVNLIGEHTDYNDGFVMPMALDRATWIAYRPRADARVLIHSELQEAAGSFDCHNLSRGGEGWLEYPKGMAWALQEAAYPTVGWDGVSVSDIPMGAGLSSSASLELAVARVFAECAGFDWSEQAMALLAQRAENEWCGMNCGVMDQMIISSARRGHALLIDCRSLKSDAVPLPQGAQVVVMDTGTRRGLVDSEYNVRRQQCEDAAHFFGGHVLRDVGLEQFREHRGALDPVLERRARHVLTENERTIDAARAMRRNDPWKLGELMNQSHESLRDLFEVSSPELDAMVNIARGRSACFGARMTGAGFGGCAVALINRHDTDGFCEAVARQYREETGKEAVMLVSSAGAGVHAEPISLV